MQGKQHEPHLGVMHNCAFAATSTLRRCALKSRWKGDERYDSFLDVSDVSFVNCVFSQGLEAAKTPEA